MESSFFRTLPQKKLLIFFLLYLFALSLRLSGVLIEEPQPDEVHWQARAHNVVSRIREGDLTRATTHLGQPGVPPGIIMAFGEVLAEKRNALFGYALTDPNYIDHLAASRLAVIIVNSLLPGVIFLGLSLFISAEFALLVAGAISLDPLLIGLSRIAHLDALLTLFVTLAIGFYAGALFFGRERLKLAAGAFWGLAIATKPTAGALIVGFILFNVLRVLYSKLKGGQRIAVLNWGDIWAFIVGHIVFALLYTRLWFHESDYLLRLKIHSKLADTIFLAGNWLQSHWIVSVCLLSLMGVALLKSHGSKTELGRTNFQANLWRLISFLFLALLAVPQVIENIVRYWTWASGLKSMAHQSYGHVWHPPQYGYWAIVFSRLPDLILCGFILGVLFLVYEGLSTKPSTNQAPGDRALMSFMAPFMTLCLVVCALWVLPLSVSPKQTFRYVLPILPLIYTLAVFGLMRAARLASRSVEALSSPVAQYLAVFLMFGSLTWTCYSATPHYQLYFNSLSGGLAGALSRGHNLPVAGQNEVVRYLHSQMLEEKGRAKVLVMGDPDSLNLVYERLYRNETERLLKFSAFDRFSASGRFVVKNIGFNSSTLSSEEDLRSFAIFQGLEPKFTFSSSSVPLTSVYQIPAFDGKVPLIIDPVFVHRNAGHRQALGAGLPTESGQLISKAVMVDKEPKGFITVGIEPLSLAGNYLAKFLIAYPAGFVPPVKPDSPKLVLRLELGRGCERVVTKDELVAGQFREFQLRCEHKVNGPQRVRIYWFGNLPALVGPIQLSSE